MATETITPKEFASIVGSDQKTVRTFLRSISPDNRPGSGGRWGIATKDTDKLVERFASWKKSRTAILSLADDSLAE